MCSADPPWKIRVTDSHSFRQMAKADREWCIVCLDQEEKKKQKKKESQWSRCTMPATLVNAVRLIRSSV